MPAPLEIHVPISPTPNFFNRIHYLAASLQQAGGLAAESSLVVTVGEDQDPVNLAAAMPWSRNYPITWRWLDRDLYRRLTYYATALDRFQFDFTSPMVLMLDADILVMKDFGDLVRSIQADNAFCGAMAHISPFNAQYTHPVSPEPPIAQRTSEEWWQAIFDRAGLGPAPLLYEYHSWNILPPLTTHRYCPPYFNFGVLLGPAAIVSRIGQTIYQDMALVDTVLSTFFRSQIALTLSLIRTGERYRIMPMRYNFPNFVEIANANPEELRDLRIMHYMNQDFFKKDATIDSVENVGAWLAASSDLPPVQQFFKDRISQLHPKILQDLRSSSKLENHAWTS